MASRENDGGMKKFQIFLESVSCERTNGFKKRQRRLRKNQSAQGPMKPLKILYENNKQKLRVERQMCVLYDFKSGYFSVPVSWVRANGSEQETGGAIKMVTDRIKITYQIRTA